jgi:hypothetical protein
VKTIVLTSDLPIISDPVVIDGTTQPGYSNAPVIELNGNDVQFHAGLSITAGNSTIRSLVLNRFHTAAIGLSTNGGNRVTGCYIGTDVTGTQRTGGGQDGINIFNSSNNVIGGTAPSEGNIIAYNGSGGVIVVPFNTNVPNTDSRNSIRGNAIYSNGGLGIDLIPFGVTPNDTGDADEGVNNLQNFPVVTTITPAGNTSTV